MGMDPALTAALAAAHDDRLERPGAFDAIVVGAGAAGGLAAERLTAAGLRVLVLDAGLPPGGRSDPISRRLTAAAATLADEARFPGLPPALLRAYRRAWRPLGRVRQPVQTRCYAWDRRPGAFVDDRDLPYDTPADRPFLWIRARGLGGRMVVPGHGRLLFRLGPDVFAPGHALAPAWPLAPGDLDPWYALVERRLGLAGGRDGLPWLPDSELAEVLTPGPAERELIGRIQGRWPGYRPVIGRFAAPPDTLATAARTGLLAVRRGAIVREVEVAHGRVQAVLWFDPASGRVRRAPAPLVFLGASALESTRILLLSRDAATGRPLGAGSDALGRYLMDHVQLRARGTAPLAATLTGAASRCLYLPRFDARAASTPPAAPGFGVQVYQAAGRRGRRYVVLTAFGEMLPRAENRVSLVPGVFDRWGIPRLRIAAGFGPQEARLFAAMRAAFDELGEALALRFRSIDDRPPPPGLAIHECGTARMGCDPATSVLDPDCQCWDARGLYVTDAAAFPSQGSPNPTLTILALTARACAHAAGERAGG